MRTTNGITTQHFYSNPTGIKLFDCAFMHSYSYTGGTRDNESTYDNEKRDKTNHCKISNMYIAQEGYFLD
ncbi:hypothetical protein OESDEN_05803 [Oesophagostomum dentatum]|uniref:Uncharacterized protein n=1 Tax=Oesophagostomum dentatum TaxID=61180 RepID=A0A0B1TDT0_OESDE|nr:hypothetical protein OESDEN_05803 [Oesophagostomum dentatum]